MSVVLVLLMLCFCVWVCLVGESVVSMVVGSIDLNFIVLVFFEWGKCLC